MFLWSVCRVQSVLLGVQRYIKKFVTNHSGRTKFLKRSRVLINLFSDLCIIICDSSYWFILLMMTFLHTVILWFYDTISFRSVFNVIGYIHHSMSWKALETCWPFFLSLFYFILFLQKVPLCNRGHGVFFSMSSLLNFCVRFCSICSVPWKLLRGLEESYVLVLNRKVNNVQILQMRLFKACSSIPDELPLR